MKKDNSTSRYNEYISGICPHTEMCVNCIYFVPHYVHFEKDRYVQIDVGHCKSGRLKTRRAYEVCGKFENRYYD